ncbi:hypothetical protein D3C81_1633860 [compost metagenome]
MGPWIRLMETQPVFPPGLHHMSAEGLLNGGAFLRTQHAADSVNGFIPGAHQLRIIHPAVSRLGWFFMRQDQPIRQVVDFFVYHGRQITQHQPGVVQRFKFLICLIGHIPYLQLYHRFCSPLRDLYRSYRWRPME